MEDRLPLAKSVAAAFDLFGLLKCCRASEPLLPIHFGLCAGYARPTKISNENRATVRVS